MNKKIVIVSVLIGFLVLLLIVGVGAFVFVGGGGVTGDTKYWQECTVDIKKIDWEVFGKSVEIKDISCVNTGKKCGLIFGFFTSQGTVELWDSSGRLASEDYKTGFLTGIDIVTIRGCTSDNQVKVRLYDEEHNLIEEKIA